MNLFLPEMPPSVNAMYGNNKGKGKGRYKMPAYASWLNVALWSLETQRGPHQTILIPVIATYLIKRPVNKDGTPTKRKMDVENYIKPISDTLVKADYIEDDSLIVDIRAAWAGEEQNKAVEIILQLA